MCTIPSMIQTHSVQQGCMKSSSFFTSFIILFFVFSGFYEMCKSEGFTVCRHCFQLHKYSIIHYFFQGIFEDVKSKQTELGIPPPPPIEDGENPGGNCCIT